MELTIQSHPYPFLSITFSNKKERSEFIHNIRTNEVVNIPFGDLPQESSTKQEPKTVTMNNSPYCKKSRGGYKEKVCPDCGKKFTPNSGRQMKCDDCRQQKAKTRTIEAPVDPQKLVKTCLICHKKFNSISGESYCSKCVSKAQSIPKIEPLKFEERRPLTKEDIARLPEYAREQLTRNMSESEKLEIERIRQSHMM